MKKSSILSVAGCALALCGCKIDSQYEMFLADAFEVAGDAGKTAPINGSFRIEMSSHDKCESNKARIGEIMSRYFSSLAALECQKTGFDDYLTFTAKSFIVNAKAASLPNNSVTGMAAGLADGGSVVLYAIIDKNRFAALQAELNSIESHVNFEVHDILIDINNDGRDTYVVGGASAFVNKEPKLIMDFEIARREKFEIRLSDVAVAQLMASGNSPIFMVKAK